MRLQGMPANRSGEDTPELSGKHYLEGKGEPAQQAHNFARKETASQDSNCYPVNLQFRKETDCQTEIPRRGTFHLTQGAIHFGEKGSADVVCSSAGREMSILSQVLRINLPLEPVPQAPQYASSIWHLHLPCLVFWDQLLHKHNSHSSFF